MTKIAIAGVAGRMGQALVRCLAQFDDLELAGAIEQPGHPSIGDDAGTMSGRGDLGVAVCDDIGAMDGADVLIDFTSHAATCNNVTRAAELGIAVVIGTTGLDAAEAGRIRQASGKVPIVWAPNMSLGVNVLFSLVRTAAAALGLSYDVEITEAHHKHKKDAPSGTALKLGTAASDGRGQDLDSVGSYGRRGHVGERTPGEIGIHAIRMGDVVGDHSVHFGAEGEVLTLSHRATSRDTFAVGALRAAQWVAGRDPGLYDMKDVLGL